MFRKRNDKLINPNFYLIIAILSYLVIGFSQYRFQPIVSLTMEVMDIDQAQVGFLMSSQNLVALFFTVPVGLLIDKIGIRKAGTIGFSISVITSLLGVFTNNYIFIALITLLQGIGNSVISVLMPYCIALLFSQEKRGRANGWYITAGTIAQLIMYNIVPRITRSLDITSVWWFTFIYGVFMLLIWTLFVKEESIQQPKERDKSKYKLKVFAETNILKLSACGMFFMASATGVLAFTPAYLVEVKGYSSIFAAGLVSASAIVGLVSTIVGGSLSDIISIRRGIFITAIAWMALSRILILFLPDGIGLYLVVWGQGVPALCRGMLYTLAGDIVSGNEMRMGITSINVGTQLGSFLGPLFFGVIVANLDYNYAYILYAFISLLSLISVCLIKKVQKN